MSRSPAFAANARTVVSALLRVGDAVVVFGAGLIAYWVRHGHIHMPDYYLVAILVGVILTLNFHHVSGLYSYANLNNLARQFGPLTVAWIAVILTLVALAYFTKTSDYFSRIWSTSWLGMNMAGFLILRLWAAYQLNAWLLSGKLKTNIAIIGNEDGRTAERLSRLIENQGEISLNLVGIFDDRIDDKAADKGKEGGSVSEGSLNDLLGRIRNNQVDEVIVTLPWEEEERLQQVLAALNDVPMDVRLCPEVISPPFPVIGYSTLAGIPMLNVFERPLSGWNFVIKAIEDYVLSAFFLILAAPFMAIIAVLIKLDSPGPVFFRQQRFGFNNNSFNVYKFRTMKTGTADEDTVPQATRDDPRVTRIGAFLRRTSLDELPQLFNVLKGEMSIVGPRPHAVAHNVHFAKIINQYLSRHKVKPGITGWAQINGLRGETETPEKMQMRVQYDLYYIEHWSLLFDLRIIFLTPFTALISSNAY